MPAGSLESLADGRSLLERALLAPRGIKISFTTFQEAKQQQQRCYSARKAAKREAAKQYPTEHPRHATSPYDALVLKLRPPSDQQEPTSLVIIPGPKLLEMSDLDIEEL